MPNIELVKGDITKMEVGAIVNAANKTLLGGGGVDGAIHRAAGPELLNECKTLNGCETGEAKITRSYLLPAKFVIHTVGPVWHGGTNNEPELLEHCYKNSLQIALENKIDSVAFPNLSTGVYRFPKEMAAGIAIRTVNHFLKQNKKIKNVYFVCFDDENYEIYKEKLINLALE
ncbi:MAG TPA: O-acetyl-ADP-ribose deacetylase [Bacteroidales bacterium]|jgi:O-acetyl-ADP-ribose deacetylase (regulator of RNase III)|nr:O-acetyl-ADP-ribose deacetylase [Bacteroidales bacterium]